MRPTLLKMLQSSEPSAVKVGARQMALAGLSIDGDKFLSFISESVSGEGEELAPKEAFSGA